MTSVKKPGSVLVGMRKGSHGAGRLALPGGHLEMGESWAWCAAREVKEETDLDLDASSLVVNHVTNDANIDGNPNKHYITIFMQGRVDEDSPEEKNMEPHKCEGWYWATVEEIREMAKSNEEENRLFDPLCHWALEAGQIIN